MKARRSVLIAATRRPIDRDTAAVIAVARSLRQLLHSETSFHLINRLLANHLDADHLAVGRTGVFAIDTCGAGEAVCSDGRGSSKDRMEDLVRQARRNAGAVRDRLRRRGLEVAVQGVVCLPFGNLERPQYVDGIIVSRPEHLEYLMRHWPGAHLTPAQCARVSVALQTRTQRAAA
jgi:hypothetical protein